MRITVDSVICMEQPPQEFITWCNDHLVMANPAYAKLLNMGHRPWSIPASIVFYSWYDGRLILPRGLLKDVWDMYPDLRLYEHRMNKCSPVPFRSDIRLRPYQAPAIQAVRTGKQGIIVMPCGAGKTETALQVIAELGQPALWITHTNDLLNQSLERARGKLHLQEGEYGIIGGGKYTIGSHITFSTVQSLKGKDLDSIGRRFGTVVVDECHRAFMSDSKLGMFEHVLEHLPALYRIGVTASEHRSDGLIKGMYYLLGKKLYEVNQEELNQAGNVIAPEVIAVPTGYRYQGDTTLEFGAMLSDMVDAPERNLAIMEYLANEKRPALVLGDRLEQLQRLAGELDGMMDGVEYICGQSSRKARQAALERMKAGESRVLFATYSLAKEGLDIPRLEQLYLLTPHRDKVAIQQAVGRIMRPAEGKGKPVVYDFVDEQEGLCMSQYRSRKAVYRKLGCTIDESRLKAYQVKIKGA
ncbi:DEAD/DEAH box helicase [Enterocloster bolteae]|uniref:DEAD/DEAH box helicase n=1 Tax=Enterocloster bolteae TaxID=208479 RepID=UPI003AF10F97